MSAAILSEMKNAGLESESLKIPSTQNFVKKLWTFDKSALSEGSSLQMAARISMNFKTSMVRPFEGSLVPCSSLSLNEKVLASKFETHYKA